MKKIIWVIACIIAIVLGFFAGKYLYKKENSYNNIVQETNDVRINNTVNKIENIEIPTSIQEEKISINTKIIEQIYYNGCNHMIETELKDITKYTNMTKSMLKRELPKWEIKEFSSDKVVLYMEDEDFCNEHFLVKDVDGYITIYTLNNSGDILEILKTTEIATQYLTEADKSSLKEGITVYTKQNLNKLIEDFE